MKRKIFLAAMSLLVCVELVGIGQDRSAERNEPASTPVLSSGSVTIKKADFVQYSGKDYGTTSSTWEDFPYMTKTFKISGIGKDEVVVMFQGEWSLCSGRAWVKLLIDEVQMGIDVYMRDETNPAGMSTNGYIWTTAPLKAGVTHTAKLQWMSTNGLLIQVWSPSMVILHR